MRIVVVGIGAIGGTLSAALALSGHEVVGVARGAQLDAIRADGLRFRTPDGDRVARFDCVASAAEIAFRKDDAIIIATKTQDTASALAQLSEAGVSEQPVFCAQNGVENERFGLRLFPNVHGVTVMLPADYVVPGEVAAFGAPCHGILDIGRYPSGADDADHDLARALDAANIASFVTTDIMSSKYGKLLMNLGNIIEATLGATADRTALIRAVRAEGEAVFAAAGVAWKDVGASDPRRKERMTIHEIPGLVRIGSSSTQSLARGAGSIESDYLNGEIVLLGRLHGVPTPVNAWFQDLARRMVREKLEPGSVSRADVHAALGL